MWKIGEFASKTGVSCSTLRRWEAEKRLIPERTLGGQRLYTDEHLMLARNIRLDASPHRVVLYCRVSSSAQKPDLNRQVEAVKLYCDEQDIVYSDLLYEVGSGLNFKRKKFLNLMRWVMLGEVKIVYVAHKDRICRFGYDLVETLVEWQGGEIKIINKKENQSIYDELTQDLLSVVHCFSSRLYSLRRYNKGVDKQETQC